jgi:hypothetical protein
MVDELLAVVDAYVVGTCGGNLGVGIPVEAETEVTTPPRSVRLEPEAPPAPDVAERPPGVARRGNGVAEPFLADRHGATEASCSRCGVVKLVAEFGRDSSTRSGRKARCKRCISETRGNRGKRVAGR